METNAQTEVNAGTQIDYEAEYNKMVAERDSYKAEAEKQKRMKDQYATENADYKKKAEAQMSDEEKRAKEHKELLDSKATLEAEIAKLKLEKEFSANGFSAEETAKLIDGNFAPKDIAEIIKARVDEGVKSAKAEATKSSTAETLLGNGSAKGADKSDFQKHQESKAQAETIVKL
jgi:colicin import membrane protein